MAKPLVFKEFVVCVYIVTRYKLFEQFFMSWRFLFFASVILSLFLLSFLNARPDRDIETFLRIIISDIFQIRAKQQTRNTNNITIVLELQFLYLLA